MNGCCPPVPPQCQPFNVPGSPGQNAFSTIIAPFAIPPDTATPVIITMGSTAWVVPGMYIIVGDQVDGHGTFVVQSVTGPTTISALWADAATDSIAGTIFNPANTPIVTGTGGPGLGGVNGVSAFTLLTANSAIPVDTNTTASFVVGNTQWMVVGQTVVVGDALDGVGTFRVTGIADSTHFTALWLNAVGDAPPSQTLSTANLAQVSAAGVPAPQKFRYGNAPASPPATSGTGETTLISVNVPGNTMVNNGDSLQFEGVFNLASGSGNNTVKIYFGATNFVTFGPLALTGLLFIRGRVIRQTGTTQQCNATLLSSTGTVTQAVEVFSTGATETLSSASLFKCTGTASAGSFTQVSLVVRLDSV